MQSRNGNQSAFASSSFDDEFLETVSTFFRKKHQHTKGKNNTRAHLHLHFTMEFVEEDQ